MTDLERSRRIEGLVYLILFTLTIPVANWMIGHVGVVCPPNTPCLVPVLPAAFSYGPLMAPSGVLMIGLALVLRDLIQRRLGMGMSLGAIALGAAISALLAPPAIVMASVTAFLLSELADFAVYTPLQRKGFVKAVILSSLIGLVVDSLVFLWLAFGSLNYLPGQVVGKAWMVLLTIPIISWLRQRDERLEMARV